MTLYMLLEFYESDPYTIEARKFKENLEIQEVQERTKTCSKYMKSLREIIYPEANSS